MKSILSALFTGLLGLLVLAVFPLVEPAAQNNNDEAAANAAAIVERARNTIAILEPLLEVEADLEDQIATANDLLPGDDEEAAAAELERLRNELAEVKEEISVVIAGVSERSYQSLGQTAFNLNTEVQNLVEPFVLLLNEATSDARELERARRGLDIAARRLDDSTLAIANIEATLAQVTEPEIATRLETDLNRWQERQTIHQTRVEALTQRIADLQSNRRTVGGDVSSAFQVFFQDRAMSLALGIAVFIGVMAACRLILYIAQRLFDRSNRPRSFAVRLIGVIFAIFSVLASFGAMLVVFNMRNDWLLLGLALLLILAALWIALRMLPNLIEQLSVLLNLGAVQENERVLFNGVPFKVDKLSFFTSLVNPALDGGQFSLPVRELIGMHSRPAAEDEAWFPSEKGDWVRLSDGNAGQVIAQTPEMVVVELLGGARITYQTADYLAATPENLSHGYRAEVVFGIGYAHQAQSTTDIIDVMRRGVHDYFSAILEPSEIQAVDVEFFRAGASSLDYEVEIDVAGSSAHRFDEIERALARCLVDLANTHGWEIPFQQIVVHGPQDGRTPTLA
ncbi:MAG: hypothetical protein AAF739_04870 [Pseudomonadota bacterium]